MPYESFATEQQVRITDVVHDPVLNAWMYLVHVRRSSSNAKEPEHDGFSHEYVISRRFREFKQLHTVLLPIMGSALTPLPAGGFLTLFMADNHALLQQRKTTLERMLFDILQHPTARELPEVLTFLGHESLSAKVLAPLSLTNRSLPSTSCSGSIRKTSSPCWSCYARCSAIVST